MPESIRTAGPDPVGAGNLPPTPGDVPDDAAREEALVIPAVELKGSRVAKLNTLDAFVVGLERLRRRIAGELEWRPPREGPSRYIDAPAWPWLAAGIVIGALFVLLLLAAWSNA